MSSNQKDTQDKVSVTETEEKIEPSFWKDLATKREIELAEVRKENEELKEYIEYLRHQKRFYIRVSNSANAVIARLRAMMEDEDNS